MTEVLVVPGVIGFIFLPALLFGVAAFTLLWLVLLLPGLLLWLWFLARICRKAGFSGWWALTSLSPPLFALAIWALAFGEWPLGPPRVEIIPPRRY